MGFLGDAEATEDTSDDTGADETVGAEQPASAQVDSSENESVRPAEPQKTERVALPSRREKAAQRQSSFSDEIKALRETMTQSQKSYGEQLAAIQQENARLRGGFEAIVPVLQRQQQPAGPAQQTPDAKKREGRKALDAGDFETWDRLNTEAILDQVYAHMPQPQQAAPQTSPVVQAMLMQHPSVVDAGERGIQLAIIKDNELALMGVPNTPERYRKAFQMAEAQLKPNTAPAYSQASRGALAGIPRGQSGGGGGGEPGVQLTAYEIGVAKRCGMSPSEYAKYVAEMDPSRVSNG